MKNLKYLLFLMVAVSLSFVACTEKEVDPVDDDDTGENGPKVDMLLTKVINTVNYSYEEYLYDADNNLQQVTYKDAAGNDLPYYDDYTYSNGKLESYTNYNNSAPTTKMIVTYNGDKPSVYKVQSNQGSGLVDDYNINLTFTGDNLTKSELVKMVNGSPVVVAEVVYTYDGDKVTKVNKGAGGYAQYEFDSKKNPYMGIGIDYFKGDIDNELLNIVPYNMTMKRMLSATDQLNEAMSVNITYEYNSNDYPIKSTSLSFDTNNEIVKMYEYKVK